MAAASGPDNTPLPGTVFTPRQVRALKLAVVVMGILLVGGFALVLGTIVYQASRGGQKPGNAEAVGEGSQGSPARSELPIPKDASLTALALDGDRLALHLKSAAGSEVAVIDVRTGKVLARIKLKPE